MHDGRSLLGPEFASLAGGGPVANIDETTLAAIREASAAMPSPPPEATTREEVVVPGEPPVPIRVHREKGVDGARPCVFSIHGGGYVMGSYAMDDLKFERWCPKLGVVGVSVEYRLAPETPYPGPLEDCYAALRWVHGNAASIGVDPNRIGVTGISAGGGLAAALVLLARDRGEVPVAFQLLDCPMLDDRQRTPSSRLDGLAIWARESNTYGWRSYLGDRYGADDLPYTAAPARCDDLAGLPPSFVSVGGADGFRDEDVEYAQRLMQAGVPTELHVYPGAPHGYQIVPTSGVARQALRDAEDWIARQLAPPTPETSTS